MTSKPTGEQLSPAKRALIEAMLRGKVRSSGIVPRANRDSAPLSFAQERLWFIDRLDPGSAVYGIPMAWRLGGALDKAALERSLGEIVRRHEALRTTFKEVDGSPVQVIAPFGAFALPVEDLSGLTEPDREAAVRRRAAEEVRRPFDLSTGPLFRASLLRVGAEDHVLLLSMHHIVSDGWSSGVLLRELSALYEAYREGRESPLAELAVQYADYAVWQREQLAGEALERQLSYWRERLTGAPELLELPTDHPRPAVQTYRGATVPVDLSPELQERLQALGRSEGATLYMTVLGAFQVLLSKYSGSDDIVVGSPIAGRTRKEIKELIGFFVNTLVLRTDLGGDPTFREVLRRAREATLGAYDHQEVPFEKLVAELRPERSLSHSPLFQVVFTLENAEGGGGTLGGLEVSPLGGELGSAKFDLSLGLMATPQGLRGGLNYSTDLFERGTVERMLGHLERVLEQVAADPDVRLSQLELLGEAEREQVLGTWNHTARESSDPPAHALFAEWVRRAPDAIALLAGREAVTYAELDRRASVLARHLRELGVGSETPVGLCMERTPELLVGVLGIWKAGGAYVPLDPAYPAERLGWIIGDAALPVVVATAATAGVLPEHGATLVRVDQLPEAEAAPEVPASAERLAYVIYTSGSTGTPKGVLVQHGSLSNLLAATREAFGVAEGDVMPALASYAFDIWLFEALLPLTSGAAVRMVERDRVLDVPALVEEIADATLVHAVPALMRQVVQSERETPRLTRLRRAFVGGDRVPADLLAEMREALPGAESHVLYGPTEATILASTHPVPADGVVHGHPIGRPLGNVRLYVCDALGSAQPAGVPGELLIGGVGVTRGYLGRAALTAERFVPDPFSAEGGARLYRTGDRARWRADGTLEYVGRTDFQVKIRGFRIEPGEIEAVLRGHEHVTDCVVVAREDVPGDRRLVAYVAGDAEAGVLREHLLRELPEYMVPSAFVMLEALPLTPNGKLDRKALPAPEYAAEADRYVAPRTPAEEVLAEIWAEVLKVERVGVHDNFFALGGHSLLAVTLVERMRRRGVRADVRALFTTPTVAELAAAVEGTGSDVRVPPNRIPAGCDAITPEMLPLVELTQAEIDRVVAGVPGGAENVQDIYPLAPLQEGILFHHLLTPENDPYLLPQPFAFESREQLDAYLAALRAAVARHDILRTSVAWEGLSEPVQVVWRDAPLSIEEVEVDPAVGDVVRQIHERIDPRQYRIDLSRAPLLRAYVGREAVEGRWGLLLLLHHMVSDHTAAEVLREEMDAYLDGRADQLPAALPFRNYVAQARLGVSRAEHEAFFRDLLGDVDEPTAPFGLREVRGDGLGLEQAVLRLEPDLGVRLRERARRLGVSVAAVCHVAWAQVLGRASGRSDVVFGTVLFGRMEGGEGADRVLGPFINTLPVRIRMGEGAEASVRRTQALLASLVRHEHASLVVAQQMSAVPAPEPLFSALFNYRHAGSRGGGGGGGKSSARGPSQAMHVMERSNYPLNLAVNDWGDRFSLSVQAEAEVGAERVCALMQTALVGLVQALEEAPERPLESIEVLPEAERRQVLEAWNRTEADVPTDLCIHELFEAQAARTPGAVAVSFEGESLTYAELNARANRLAHHLRALGVGPDARVAICVERGPEMVAALLAILKAGGAYVPLDPAYPADRLRYMLEDSAPAALVTQSSLAGTFAGLDVPVVELDAAAPAWAQGPETNPACEGLTPDHLAYVIYTSGSTGRPKGVMIGHRSLVNHTAWQAEAFGIGAGDTVLQRTSISFDASVWELWTPLATGARMLLLSSETMKDPAAIGRVMAEEGVTIAQFVPLLLQAVLGALPAGASLPCRTLFCGGEPLSAALVEEARAAGVGEVVNLYGPTEATIDSTWHPVPAGDGRVPAIGRPIANARMYVLDARGAPAPAGVAGELYVGGAGLARGYLGRAALTAERFVPDPFSVDAGARLYRTGDLGRWRADGTLEFLGRTDFQVKVRGFRIELGEIEAALLEHEAVRECAVVVRADAGEKRVVAYVVADGETDALRTHARRILPDYMVPGAFVALERLPLTPNGKLDRKALPAPELASGVEKYVAPRTPVEEVLAGIWAEVLRLERVGVEESFFELGGHSLLATRVVSRVREVFAVELPLRALFEGPTVAEVAGRVEEMRRAEVPVLPPVVPTERTGALPLSFAQERLWFIDRLEPGSGTYNIPAALRLTGALDERALERALGEIVRRHEALRTVFAEVDDAPVQVIAPFDGFVLPVEDLAELSESDREAAVGRRAGEEARRAFDLSAGPLFRASLLRLGSEDHVLLLAMHHIVSDGWSGGVLFRELSALYAAYLEGRESPLPELPVQYADYAVWQREQLVGEVLGRQLSYWREHLAGAPELLELPTDHPRPAMQTFRGAMVPVRLSAELVERLQALGRSEGATLYMTLLGAFQVLLSKYSGSGDIVVGSPIAGRTRKEVEELIGFFVNTLVLRTDLGGDPSFRQVLRRAREATLGAYEHQEVPFEKLVAELQPERSLSHSPLFQVMFTLENAEGGGSALPGLSVRGVGAELESAKFDLSLALTATAQGVRGGLNYSTDLFERGTIERMLGHLERVLEQVAADADVRLSQLELLGSTERALVLEEWNRTERPYPRGVCIHELFEAQVRERPEAVALVWGEAELTYQDLSARANRLAHHLVRLGVGPEARVGVMLERGVDLIVSLLAVLKAGGAYVPLDPAYPAERLRLMLDDSGVRVLLSRSELAEVVDTGDLDVVHLDRSADAIASQPIEAPRGTATAENLAYIVYTSGSTGRPKGVMVGHRQVVQLVVETDYVRLRPGDRVAQASNAGFDALTFEVWGAFLNGATLVGIPQDVLISPRALRQALRAERISTIFLTTALVNQLSHEEPDIFSSVREVLFGGQAVDAESVRRLLKAGRPERLLHMYGPTETTTYCLYEEVEHVAEDALTVPLGHATGNQRIYLLDGALNPVPRGVPGEAFVGGAGVARGYLDRSGLTAERFIPDPFSTEAGARMYRTGDRMRWRGERKLEFVGRVDEQVKIRGFRIEPGEVESVLSAHAAVREARVIVREDQPGEKRLVAYVVGEVEADEVREHLRRTLPDYMVPAAFVVLQALPLTPNGKLDRKALPAPELASGEAAYVAPRTPTEEVLAGVWAEMLGRERVGAEESFFDLGGHSLLATRVAARVRAVFGVELPLRAVFERSVLRELAAEIDRLRGSGAAAGADAIVRAAREGDLPVTFAQERLWFVDALDPGSPVYAIPFAYRITGGLDHDALRRALAELVRRHEPLRTTLPAVDGVPVQRIAPAPAEFELPVTDLRQLPEEERRAEAGRLAAEATQHRFDLARGPLFRASLVHVSDAEHLLLLNLHHAVGDGWSLGVLLEELSTLYGSFSRGEGSPLPEPALQYADYAVWQHERLSGAALERQVEFWRSALDGAPALLELPTDRPRPPVESHRGAAERLLVSSELTAEVHALARREGATLFMVLLAALDVVLGRLAGQEDVVVGTPIAGRTRAETDRMVGLFLNSLALRTDLSGDPSFRELLGRVRETTLAAYAHQELPFERVLEEVRPERSLAHAPVFQVMLNLANFQDGSFRAEGLEVAQAGGGGEMSSKFDLTLYVGERDGGIYVNLVYAADLFDAPRMRGFLAQLEGVLRQAAAAPETRVGALSLATEAARGVLPDPARPIEAEAWHGAVHETFAAHAAESPEALAVADAAETWTYAELDAAANRIAHRLIEGGVRPGDVVAVHAHRSAALVRALLGAWKAGAAFAVLDPAYPPARLAAQVGAAHPTALLRISAAGEVPAEVAAALAETARTTVLLPAGGDDGLGGFSSAAPAVSVAPDDLAYVAFTSGTTGTPKAIAGTHRPLAHFFGWYAREFGLSAGDRFSLLSGLAHDPLLRDVFAPLAVGGSIAIPDAGEIGTPGWLAGWMRDSGVTVAHLTPAMAQVVTSSANVDLPALRLACFGGDVLRAADVERLRAAAPDVEAVNFYGATETPQAMGVFRLPADLAEVGRAVPVGRGIDGVDLLVITPSGTLAGIGELGEIAVRTPYLSRGYLNDAALSASRFVVNPWTGEPGDLLYRTGDLGRYRPDGLVEPMGRADQQVKVRGFRVELGEVEGALASHPTIREAAVIAREADAGDRRLVAYWVPAEGSAEPDAASLRLHLKALLPEYMVPSAYVRVERLPLTANGKLDRRALPEPEPVATDARPAAPSTPTEEILAQIWAEVLRIESVGVDDDFFALGGHSLLATRLLWRVQNALGVVLPLRAVFEGPTVAQLAARVEEMRRAGLPVLPPVAPVDRDRPLPLSFAQERLWFLDRLEGGSASYNIPTALRLRGALDVDALERSLGEIVRRHESLRTVFREVDGGAVQVIAAFAGFALPIDDLSTLDPAAREVEVRRRTTENAARPFDLAAGPLFRAALLRVADEEHVLLMCIHHIVSDGWSSGVLLRELSALYAAYHQGGDSPLAEPPVQYADFAVWQREQLRGEVLDRQIGYWKDRLAGAPALLELPTDRPRPPVQSHRGAREMFDLPRSLLDRLQALGRSEGATLYMVMLGAFQLLLSKYSGSEDVVVGSPIAGRTRKEVEELIGFFANTLVLRTDLSADPTFRELLGRVREGTLGAYEHQEVPFERLVAELQPERSLSHAPLFQVMFILQNVDLSGSGLAGLRMEGVLAESDTTRFDLALTAVPHDGGVRGALEYSTALFDRSTIQRMLGHLERLLEQVAARPEARLSELDLLSVEERGLVVEEWNRTAAEYPADRCIHELFEAQAARTPDAVAVEFEGETLRYGALNERANRLAHHLAGLGVGPETRVGICLERGPEMVVSVLAVLKAGGAFVPLDPAYPAERLAFVLADSAVPVLVTQESLRATLPAGEGVAVVSVDGDGARIAAESAENPGRGVLPENAAYVIYTSGSTGTPKGVMVPHRGVPNLAYAQAHRFGIDGSSRVLQFASFSFDAAVAEVFDTLLTGATLVMASREALLPGAGLLETLRGGRVTVATLPPSVLAMLSPDDLPELRTVVSAGEAVDAATVERWSGGRAFVNAYGPTETTVCATTARCEADERAPAIGRALENVQVYVLDAAGRPAPVGVPGELYVGGMGVARGYLGRPALTAEKFVPNPFSGETGARLYRTGDRVRWRAEGILDYLGRIDHQVKVRGFRIEPGEIEARLTEHAGVREAVVLVREDAGEKRLVAYVVGDETAGADVLRAHLLERLPEYMVPAAYVRLDVLPLTPNGKVDRKALPAPEGDAFSARGYEPPSGTVEEAVAEIWAELLGTERVGRRDHFFELGGHSLLAVRVVSRVRQALGVELSPRDLFERPVLADFARGLQTAAQADATVIVPVERSGPLALSLAQQRLWFLEQMGNLGSTYHMPMRLRLRGELHRNALARALDRIVARHEALRTSFPSVDGEPVQHIAPADRSGFRLVEHDLRASSHAENELRRLVQEEASAPFDLAQGPLFRGRLVRMTADDNVLLLTMHHIVSDGWSMGVLFRELGALYAAFSRGEPDPLPPLPVQYADYAVWHRRWVEGPVLEAQAEYWTRTLAGAPELLELPTDHPRPAKQDFTGASVKVELDEALTGALKTLGQRHGTTLFMTLLAGWAAVLARLSGQDDVVIGTPTANRGRGEIEGLIGFFVNTLPLRVDLSGAPSVAGLLDRVKGLALEAQRNQDISFEQVVELVQPARSLAHTPLFQVMFTWQNAAEGSLELPGLALSPLHPAGSGGSPSRVSAKFDLSLTLQEHGGRIGGSVDYATALFDQATVERHVGYLRQVLEEMVADDAQAVDALQVLPAAERRLVVDEWNRTDADLPAAPVHRRFEAQVEKTPGATAVVSGADSLTYAELNARANRLARWLRGRGVGAEVRVGLCLERGPEMVVAILGVLKAGGAYVPLDPSYPAERLAYMAADSALRVVLTQERLLGRLPFDGSVEAVALDARWGEIETEDAADPAVAVDPRSLAYVLYTSGSTGRPKGVAVEHTQLGAYLTWATRTYPGGGSALHSSLAFDLTVTSLFVPLLGGGAVELVEEDDAVEGLARVLERGGREMLKLTPAHLRILGERLEERGAVGGAACLVVGGEPLIGEQIGFWIRQLPETVIVNEYGPTETVVGCSIQSQRLADTGAGQVSIGRPVPNTRLYVLDARGEPVPVGVPGELYVGGAQVTRGYLGRPGLTAERFVPDPFGRVPGARLYRTGDRVRWLADGTLEFLGRTDFQVKIRGFRIELGEIEAAIRSHDAVRDALVLAREDEPGDQRLVAYYLADEPVAVEALRAHLGERLPEYMVPAAYVWMEEYPQTTNGKTDRAALPAPGSDAFAARGYEAPASETEEAVAAIWAELLRVERVGRHDNFFQLGGNSLLATRLVFRIRREMDVDLSVADVFEKPELSLLAQHLVEVQLAQFDPDYLEELLALARAAEGE
jgi:amino acid adenylation domain-containing protein